MSTQTKNDFYNNLKKNFHKFTFKNPFTSKKLGVIRFIKSKNIYLPKKEKIIGKGVYGTTYELKECSSYSSCTNKSYIAKVIELRDGITMKHIKDEVSKSKMNLLQYWGVISHCYSFVKYKNKKYGIIIMDHVLRKYPLYEFSTLNQYKKKYGITKSLKESLAYTFSYFYSTPKVHGDLHSNNILVIHNKKNVLKVKIIDYFTTTYSKNNNTTQISKSSKSIYKRMQNSHKILINDKLKNGTLVVYNKKRKAINSSPQYKDLNIKLYHPLNKLMKNTPALLRSNLNLFSINNPELMKYIKHI